MNSSGKVSTNRLAVVGTAIVCVLIILASLLPIQVGISTEGMLSIGLRQASANPDWLSGWDQRVKLSVDADDVSSNLTDFPILLHLSTSSGYNAEDISFIFDKLQSNANRFKIAVTKSDEITECYIEIEKWDDANEKADLWVKAPTVSNLSDSDFWFYFDADHADNTAYVGDAGSTISQSVWNSNFKFVNHLADYNVEAYKSQVYQGVAGEGYFATEPMVIYRAGETHPWKVWLHTNHPTSSRIRNYYSDDGISWTDNGLASPNSLYAEPYVLWNPEGDNKYWMYACNAFGGPFDLLTSSNETGFTVDTANTLTEAADASKFDDDNVYNPSVWYEEPDSTANLITSMDNSTTECDVNDTSKFAATQYIKIESEWMLVTAVVNATHCHATRAKLGTSAVAHTQPQDVYKRQWYMAYDGSYAAGGAPIRVGLALSYDGRAWTKQYNGSGSGGSWLLPGERHSDAGTIYKVNGVYYHCGHGNWINGTDGPSDIQGWSYSTDLASWTALGGTGYQSFIARTQTWEGTGHVDGQTADLCGLVDNNANPVTVGGYSYFYYTGVMQQAYDSSHPSSIGLVKLPGTFTECVINYPASMCDSTSSNNDPDQVEWPTPATGAVANGRNIRNDAIGKSILRFPDSASHDLGTSFTLEASVYLDAYLAGPDVIVNKDAAGAAGTRQFIVALDGAEDNTKRPICYFWDTDNHLVYWVADAGHDISTGWHRIAFVRDANTAVYIYIDGAAVANTKTGTLDTAMQSTTCPLYLGYRTYLTHGMDGNADEVRMLNKAYSAAEAKASYETQRDHLLDWGSEEGITPAITNTPDNYGFGILATSTNGSTTINYFTLNNTGNCPVDVTIQGTNLAGGDDTWTLSGTATPGENIYGLYAGLDDDDDNFDIVVNTTANAFVGDLPEATTQAWGLRLCMPTSLSGYDAQQMSGNVTLIASAA